MVIYTTIWHLFTNCMVDHVLINLSHVGDYWLLISHNRVDNMRPKEGFLDAKSFKRLGNMSDFSPSRKLRLQCTKTDGVIFVYIEHEIGREENLELALDWSIYIQLEHFFMMVISIKAR